jgi:hypothetical protein
MRSACSGGAAIPPFMFRDKRGGSHRFPKALCPPKKEVLDLLRALTGLSNTVTATADVGHFASCGYDTVVDASGGEVEVSLGRRISKIPEVMRELHRQGFVHLIEIEYEKEDDVNRDMKADVEFARKFA